MPRTQQKYTKDFKTHILSLYKSGEKNEEELIYEYQIPKTTLTTWLKQADEIRLPDGRILTVKDLLSLEKRCQKLETENQLLKKLRITLQSKYKPKNGVYPRVSGGIFYRFDV